ncbi:hypothetical protein [Bradyrhizobium sp. AZCC 2230]|uniref:hypothetical protein n=1 Tax=Bradyrhizobium sp. AZCC 2230 TaxID=3117021 RepID=UPI002FEEC75B
MARKAAGYDAGEKDTVEYLTKLFEAAKFEIQREMDLGDRPRFDLVVSREELGRYRKFVVELVLVQDARGLVDKYEQLVSYSRSRKVQDIDEYWLVSNLSLPDRPRIHRSRFPNVRAFTVKELERMLARLSPKRSAPKGKAKTKIGKAIEANEKEIVLAIEGLMLQVNDKLAKLRDERPNDPDAVKKKDDAIAEFEDMRAELERIKVAVQQLKKNEVKEKDVVQTVTTFKDTIGKWWNKNHDAICSTASNSALFLTATGLLHAIGADSTAALTIAGSLIGGETVAKALKALPRSLFKKEH